MLKSAIRILFCVLVGGLIIKFVFAPVLVPLLFKALPNEDNRKVRPYNICISQLRFIDAAAQQFALEHNLTNGSLINFPNDLTPYIKLNSEGKIPGCPQGGIYHISKVGETPTCTLSTATPPHALQ
jgi:hypothetical protein